MKIDNQFLLMLLFHATPFFCGNVIILAVGRTHINSKIKMDTGLSLSTVLVWCCCVFGNFMRGKRLFINPSLSGRIAFTHQKIMFLSRRRHDLKVWMTHQASKTLQIAYKILYYNVLLLSLLFLVYYDSRRDEGHVQYRQSRKLHRKRYTVLTVS
jgi:hypothetical protein